MLHLILAPAAIACLCTWLMTRLVIHLAPSLKVIDDPRQREHPAGLHDRPIPRGGGIAVLVGVALAAAMFLPIDRLFAHIFAGAFVVVAIGYLDDRYSGIHPYWRLAAQLVAAGVILVGGVGISSVSHPLGGVLHLSHSQMSAELFGTTKTIWILSALVAVVWVVGLMNAVSWSSGVDGQLSGFTMVAAGVVAIHTFQSADDPTQALVCVLAAATAGAYLGFLPWHVYPQKIMPGFGGATLAGFMLGAFSILATAKIGMVLIVLAVPLADAAYLIARRIMEGKNPIWGDNRHLHHRLLRLGWSKRAIAHMYWLSAAVLGAIALSVDARALLATGMSMVALVGLALVALSGFEALQNAGGSSAARPPVPSMVAPALEGETRRLPLARQNDQSALQT